MGALPLGVMAAVRRSIVLPALAGREAPTPPGPGAVVPRGGVLWLNLREYRLSSAEWAVSPMSSSIPSTRASATRNPEADHPGS